MFGTVVSLIVLVALLLVWLGWRRRQRRLWADDQSYVPTHPELRQRYGASDAATGMDADDGEPRTGMQPRGPDNRPIPTSETRGWDPYGGR